MNETLSGECSPTHDGKVLPGAESGQLLDASLPPITSCCICTMPGKKVASNRQPAEGKQKHCKSFFYAWQRSGKPITLILNSLSLSPLPLPLSAESRNWLLWWLHRERSPALHPSASHFCEGDALQQAAGCQRQVLQQQISINCQRSCSQWQHHTGASSTEEYQINFYLGTDTSYNILFL